MSGNWIQEMNRLTGPVPAHSNPGSPAEFENCPGCEMRGTCRSLRHCTGPSLQQVAARVDADTSAWKKQAETIWCDAVNNRDPADVATLRAHLDRVVAVRA